MIFAKNKESVIEINDQLIQKKFFKEYLAIVEKKELSATGTLVNHLVKSSKLKKSFVNEKSEGDESILNYKVLHEMDRYLVLNIELVTGRFHQIRSQLAHIGLPVKGDVKYGARRGNKDRTIGLHAWKAALLHPSTKIQLNFEASLPINDIWPIVQQLLITI